MPSPSISCADPIGTFSATAAWFSLTQTQRDLIGSLAVKMVFAGFVSEAAFAPAARILGAEINADALDVEAGCMNALVASIEKALPAVFGAGGEDPAWIFERRPGAGLDSLTDAAFLQAVIVQPLAIALQAEG